MKNNIRALIWAALHLLVLALFLVLPRASIETDFISIIPKISANREFEKPLRDFFAGSANTITVFAESGNFESAKKTAFEMRDFVSGISDQIRVNLEKSTAEFTDIVDLLSQYTFHLLPDTVKTALEEGRAAEVAEDALAAAYSPFYIPIFSDLEKDPFLLFNSKAEELLSNLGGGNSLSQKDGVLYTSFNGKHNVFFTIELPNRFTDGNSWITVLDAFLPYLERLNTASDVHVYTSGVLIHSYYSQKSAEKEITLISVISFLIIFLIFLSVFRSLRPFLVCMSAVLVSVGFAYAVSSIVFKSIHIFAFVFGTSLIGITIDYSIHYISDWFFEKDTDVLKKIFPGLLLGLLTTVTSYVVLQFSGLSLLAQMSVFSIAGMLSSFLTVTLLYPVVFAKKPLKSGQITVTHFSSVLETYRRIFGRKNVLPALFTVLTAVGIFGVLRLRHDFSAATMYSIPPALLENEIAVNERLNNPASSDLLFIKGASPEDALVLQEKILPLVPGVFSISSLAPSINRQQQNLKLAETELLPLSAAQFTALGFEPDAQTVFETSFAKMRNTFLEPQHLFRFSMLSELQKLLYKSGDIWISVVPLAGRLSVQDEQRIESLSPDARVFSVQEEIDGALALTVEHTIRYTIIAYALIFIFLLCTFRKKQAVQIFLLQLFSVFMNCAAHGILGLSMNMFSILALILALGISIDYFIFFAKSRALVVTVFIAVFLSMLTTLFSFGTLSFSSFIPVKSFALSLFFGIFFSFLLSPLLILRSEPEVR